MSENICSYSIYNLNEFKNILTIRSATHCIYLSNLNYRINH